MNQEKKKTHTREYVESLLVALVVALLLRSFVVEAFKIPSDSMVPTLMTGDHIFVSKMSYGVRVPLTRKWLVKFSPPKRGDVIVFRYPNYEQDPKKKGDDYIKRVVGLPGDRIVFENDQITINGETVIHYPLEGVMPDPRNKRKLLVKDDPQDPKAKDFPYLPYYPSWSSNTYFVEKMGERYHLMQWSATHHPVTGEVIIPEGHLFVMGDNRDNSSDSRDWGFVPLENVKGRALIVWLSWDHDQGGVRVFRFGHVIK